MHSVIFLRLIMIFLCTHSPRRYLHPLPSWTPQENLHPGTSLVAGASLPNSCECFPIFRVDLIDQPNFLLKLQCVYMHMCTFRSWNFGNSLMKISLIMSGSATIKKGWRNRYILGNKKQTQFPDYSDINLWALRPDWNPSWTDTSSIAYSTLIYRIWRQYCGQVVSIINISKSSNLGFESRSSHFPLDLLLIVPN